MLQDLLNSKPLFLASGRIGSSMVFNYHAPAQLSAAKERMKKKEGREM
jgi:hypothetical protein